MTKLYFRLGSMDGFTSHETAEKTEGFDIPIRELMQNSLDAAGEEECRVEILIEEIATEDIPHLNDYRRILDLAIKTQKNEGAFNSQQKQVVENLWSEVGKKNTHILMFADDAGGMDRDGLNALIEHRSRKSDSSGGSFGVGHLKSYDLSSSRYVLYGTRKNGATLFTGVPILAGFQDDGSQRGNVGRIVKRIPSNEQNPDFEYPDRLPDFMQRVMRDRSQGTVVCILGLSDKWELDYETVIARHFFSALLHERLSVSISQSHGDKSITELDGERIEHLLSSIKGKMRANTARGEILCGQHTWQSFLAVRDSSIIQIELSSGDRVNVYVRTGDIENSSVALIRSDMLIARHDTMLSPEFKDLRNSDDLAPFALVIDVDKELAGKKLFDLVKAAEGPYHNKLTGQDLNRERSKNLRELFRELAGKVREHLPRIDREGFDLPIFDSITASVDLDRKAKPKGVSGIGFSERKAPPKPKPDSDGSRPGPPPMFGRPAEAKIEARTERTGESWRIRVRITPTLSTQPKDRVVLSFAIAEDRDNGIAGDRLTPNNVMIDGHPGKVVGGVIPLGALTRLSPVDVEATVDRSPGSAMGATAGVLSVLSLKRTGPPNAADADQEDPEPA